MIAQKFSEGSSNLNKDKVALPLMKQKVEGRGCEKLSLLPPKLQSAAMQQGFSQEGSLLL